MLKSQNVSRSLSFRSAIFHDSSGEQCNSPMISGLRESGSEQSKSIRLSSKQVCSFQILFVFYVPCSS